MFGLLHTCWLRHFVHVLRMARLWAGLRANSGPQKWRMRHIPGGQREVPGGRRRFRFLPPVRMYYPIKVTNDPSSLLPCPSFLMLTLTYLIYLHPYIPIGCCWRKKRIRNAGLKKWAAWRLITRRGRRSRSGHITKRTLLIFCGINANWRIGLRKFWSTMFVVFWTWTRSKLGLYTVIWYAACTRNWRFCRTIACPTSAIRFAQRGTAQTQIIRKENKQFLSTVYSS